MLHVGDTTSPTGAYVSRRQRGADVYLHDVVGSVLGVVRFSVTDVAMLTHDVPITVTRHYDSTDPRRGDFGYGWTLEESESSVQVSRPLGEGIAIWSRIRTFALPCTDVFEQKQHCVEIRLSDDEYYTFGVEVSNLAAISGRCFGDVFMEQVAGTVGGAELVPLENTLVFGENFRDVTNPLGLPPSSLADAFTLEVWNETEFELQLPDGRSYRVDTERGTTALVGPNGLSVVHRNVSFRGSASQPSVWHPPGPSALHPIYERSDRGAEEFQWRKDGVPIPFATSNLFDIIGADLDDSGDYDVVVSNVGGSVTSVVATLEVVPPNSGGCAAARGAGSGGLSALAALAMALVWGRRRLSRRGRRA